MKQAKLFRLITNIFKKHGLSTKHSVICSKAILNAELVGAPSHGVSRIASYCNRIKNKVINAKPNIKIKKISSSVTHIDADNAVGFIGADLAINKAIQNAQRTGIGFVAVKNSGHYGLSGYYAEKAAKKGMVAFCFTNAPPAIAPYGAKKLYLAQIQFVLLLYWIKSSLCFRYISFKKLIEAKYEELNN